MLKQCAYAYRYRASEHCTDALARRIQHCKTHLPPSVAVLGLLSPPAIPQWKEEHQATSNGHRWPRTTWASLAMQSQEARTSAWFAEAVPWIVRTGSPWRDLLEEFGKCNAVFKCFRECAGQTGQFRADLIENFFDKLNVFKRLVPCTETRPTPASKLRFIRLRL